jgi:hypothetical protein
MTRRAPNRKGSRLLLGLALLSGALGAMYLAALLADVAMDLFGVVSRPVRLAGKTLLLAASVPCGFLLVERAFLAWTSRRTEDANRNEDPKGR